MQNKNLTLIAGILILLLGATAFVAARLLNQRLTPVDLGAPFTGDFRSMILPAPELPTTAPDVTGPFVERQDNKIIVETKSLQTGGIGAASSENTKSQTGPLVEVVVTSQTIIYRETTQPDEPLSAENQTIRQTVEPATLEALDSRSMIMVWGRKSGDRLIAEVLMYSDLVAVKSAIFEDCEICP
jgi:hypothetical protein